jgi:hypothetical protein
MWLIQHYGAISPVVRAIHALLMLQMVLSLVGCLCCCLATCSGALKLNKTTGGGGPASYMGCLLPCAPCSVGRMPCGQGSPLLRPDGAGQFSGKVIDVRDEDDGDKDGELDSTLDNFT